MTTCQMMIMMMMMIEKSSRALHLMFGPKALHNSIWLFRTTTQQQQQEQRSTWRHPTEVQSTTITIARRVVKGSVKTTTTTTTEHTILRLRHLWQTLWNILIYSCVRGLVWMTFSTVNFWCHMEVCCRSYGLRTKRKFDQRFLFWQRVHEECGCHWTKGVIPMVYEFARL